MLRRYLILFTLAALLYGAGTVTQTLMVHSTDRETLKITADVTADASNGSVPATVLLRSGGTVANTDGWAIVSVETDPGGTAPTDNWDLTITNPQGVDLLGGACANRDTSNSESCTPTALIPIDGNLTLNVSGNSVNSATIRIVVNLARRVVAKNGGIGGAGGSGEFVSAGSGITISGAGTSGDPKVIAVTSGAAVAAIDYLPVRTSATILTLPAVAANVHRVGEVGCAAVASSTLTVTSGTGTLWIARASDCTVVVRHNIVGTCSATCTAVASSTGFDPGDLPLYQWTVTSGALAAAPETLKLTQYASRPLVAGTNVSFSHTAGVTTINGAAAFDPLDLSVGWVRDEFIPSNETGAAGRIVGQLGWKRNNSPGTVYSVTNLGARHVGILRMTNASTAYGSIDLATDAVPIKNPFSIAGWEMKFVFRVPVLSGANAKAGLYGAAAAGIADYIGINYSEGTDTNWQCIMRAASGTEFKSDTGVVVSATTWVAVRLRSTVAGTVRCSVAVDDGSGGALGAFSAEKTFCAAGCDVSQTVPAVDMTPFFYLYHASATADMDIDKFFMSWTGL